MTINDDIVTIRLNESSPSLFENVNLSISQSTALETQDYQVAFELSEVFASENLSDLVVINNDVTNTCVSLALKIGDIILKDCERESTCLS